MPTWRSTRDGHGSCSLICWEGSSSATTGSSSRSRGEIKHRQHSRVCEPKWSGESKLYQESARPSLPQRHRSQLPPDRNNSPLPAPPPADADADADDGNDDEAGNDGLRPPSSRRAGAPLSAEEAAARQASAEVAEAQRLHRAEHANIVETLAGMFPDLDRDIISDVVYQKEGR